MKLFVLTYGVGRGGELTLANINRIYSILSKKYDTRLHYVFNSHRHEWVSDFEFSGSVTLQDCWTPRAEEKFNQCRKFDDVHGDNFVAIKNLFQQFEMLNRGYEIAKSIDADITLFVRDDILIDAVKICRTVDQVIKKNRIWFSAFHGNCGYCERFGILPRRYLAALDRFNYLDGYYREMQNKGYILRKGLNGEWLYRYIIDSLDVDFVCSYLKSARVREKGIMVSERLVPRPWHANSEWQIFNGVIRYYLNG